MRIKKKHKNEYLLAGNIWVRNFCNRVAAPVDINHLNSPADYLQYLDNEIANRKAQSGIIERGRIKFDNIIIVSDGFDFDRRQKLLNDLPSNVIVMGVNRALVKWHIEKPMAYYVVNNPYSECLKYLPTDKFPICLASTRTNLEFIKAYKGNKFFFLPTPNDNYSSAMQNIQLVVDDYRNSICAAIGLAYQFGVKKLLLFCCDDSFEKERPGSVQLENSLWTYPQQLMSQHIVEANLYWLSQQKISLGNCSSGINYANTEYISETHIASFFGD